jgi:imidazolonepropionase-like amidohydrolase
MYEAGVTLIAGSDCGPYNSFTYPGESLHGELHMLVKAGLTPRQAMTTSIINGPKFFELEKYYGSIDRGKVADLILLDKNPVENIDHTRTIRAVVKKGKVYDRQTLDRMLLELK